MKNKKLYLAIILLGCFNAYGMEKEKAPKVEEQNAQATEQPTREASPGPLVKEEAPKVEEEPAQATEQPTREASPGPAVKEEASKVEEDPAPATEQPTREASPRPDVKEEGSKVEEDPAPATEQPTGETSPGLVSEEEASDSEEATVPTIVTQPDTKAHLTSLMPQASPEPPILTFLKMLKIKGERAHPHQEEIAATMAQMSSFTATEYEHIMALLNTPAGRQLIASMLRYNTVLGVIPPDAVQRVKKAIKALSGCSLVENNCSTEAVVYVSKINREMIFPLAGGGRTITEDGRQASVFNSPYATIASLMYHARITSQLKKHKAASVTCVNDPRGLYVGDIVFSGKGGRPKQTEVRFDDRDWLLTYIRGPKLVEKNELPTKWEEYGAEKSHLNALRALQDAGLWTTDQLSFVAETGELAVRPNLSLPPSAKPEDWFTPEEFAANRKSFAQGLVKVLPDGSMKHFFSEQQPMDEEDEALRLC